MKTYICIDLKSFFASVECVERGLDPMNTNLVVADLSRTEKTICLAVTPSLKAYGISGRARLFEVEQKLAEVNNGRREQLQGRDFSGSSYIASDLNKDKSLEVSYIAAPPRMAFYMRYSRSIYGIYLKYFAPEDIHVYSIDEVFIDITPYLAIYKKTPREIVMDVVREVLDTTGITATAGIGTNLYLCKIAMDIVAKHVTADENGVRIAELDEMSYRKLMWGHKPITDFWRVGAGYAGRLAQKGMFTMGDVALCSVENEELLYKMFGVNAELLIDHAWGLEPCTIKDIKNYVPESSSLSSGQVLKYPYDFEKALIIVREMADNMSLELVEKGLVTDQVVLDIGYDIVSVNKDFKGELKADRYGRKVPKKESGSANIEYTSSSRVITQAAVSLFEKITDCKLFIRRITITANHIISCDRVEQQDEFHQLDLFGESTEMKSKASENEYELQKAVVSLKKRYGKNSVLRGTDFLDGATMIERNGQIGGHKA